ncbi:IS481 family transposase, partial [Vibrio fluvialis]
DTQRDLPNYVQDKMCCGRMPMETLLDGKPVWAEKNLAQI